MSRVFYFLVLSIFITSCSSSANVETNVKSAETNTAVNKSVAATINQPDANAEIPNNANRVVIQNSAITKDNIRIWERKKGAPQDNTPIADNIIKSVTAAPDNSEILSEMNEKGQPVETRTFKKHGVLAKIERIDLDNRNIKVYLKNGKVVNLPEGRIENFLTAPAGDILKALGIK